MDKHLFERILNGLRNSHWLFLTIGLVADIITIMSFLLKV